MRAAVGTMCKKDMSMESKGGLHEGVVPVPMAHVYHGYREGGKSEICMG